MFFSFVNAMKFQGRLVGGGGVLCPKKKIIIFFRQVSTFAQLCSVKLFGRNFVWEQDFVNHFLFIYLTTLKVTHMFKKILLKSFFHFNPF